METNKNELYEAPVMIVIEVKIERAILNTSGEAPQYDGPINF